MSTGAIKRHYEKVIAACCFLILFTNVGLPSTSFSVFQPYLVDLPDYYIIKFYCKCIGNYFYVMENAC